ncbi:D-2-hydroxyacid dehydrogenase [Streptomyces sp. NBC_01264]|uniref:D-2-hydroxyacid dehydrogenase n=1 Tax=Streptomyces sp. NBC_01264 TaxID=2903804 RepID=UPI00225A199E|nr:D-2-hydroxyacid dehydrogenase [Streptomyces sp. NBC_01264]MCX4781707.1 D-2-hydroxyacid dehydrogenase [Streptomyces sp. NBC_01264]
MAPRDEIVVGLAYPAAWDRRPPGTIARDVGALKAVDRRVVVAHCSLDRPRPGPPAIGVDRLDVAVALTVPPDVTRIAPRLRWVQSLGADVGSLMSRDLAGAGIRVTSASGVNAVAVAEFAFARVLAHFKRLDELALQQRAHRWIPRHGTQLAGRTLGILGLGAIGTELARRARAFGMHVTAVRRHTGMRSPDVDRLFRPADLHAMLAECHAVVACLPDTAETVDVMDTAAFAAMRPGAFFCNVGRGTAVVEEGLVAALRAGHLGGAAIDVTRDEPLAADSPLWDVQGLAVSPHCATAADVHFEGLYGLLRENLTRFLDGRPLINEVDPVLGY